MHLKTRIQIIVTASLLGLLVISGFGLYTIRHNLYEERRSHISQSLDFADSLIKHYHALEVSGKMSSEDAQRRAIEAINAQRQGVRNYYFIRDYASDRFIQHPIQSRIGKIDDGGKLPDGRTVTEAYREGLKTSTDNKAYLELDTLKPGEPEYLRFPKLNGVLKFDPWGWIVGIGFFIDDIDARFWQQAAYFLGASSVLLAFVAIFAFRMRGDILKQLGGEPYEAAENMRRIAEGDLHISIHLAEDDNSSMMASLKLMQMKLINITAAIQENSDALSKQVAAIDVATRNYVETHSLDALPPLLLAINKVHRIVGALNKSIARFKL